MVGVDVIEVKRIKKAMSSARFASEVFTEGERAYCKGYDNFAGIYAAKEAFAKATGTGLTRSSFYEIEIAHDEKGAPYYELSERIKKMLGNKRAGLSISHDGGIAVAVCVLEG